MRNSHRPASSAWKFQCGTISSVAAPLFNAAGVVVGALHSHGPTYRFPDEALRDIISGRMRSTAQAISAALGHVA